jgi:hypothetical protein
MCDSLRHSFSGISALAVLTLSAGLATAQVSTERRQAILDYQLNLPRANQLITAMVAMTKYVVSMPDYQDRMRKAAKMSPGEGIAAMEKDPKAMAILQQNRLTAREYHIGVPVLRMAIMAAQGISSPNIIASPSNIAFAKANLAQLKSKMDAADGGGAARK